MRSLPTGSAYAVCTAVGGPATVGMSLLRGKESSNLIKLFFIAMIVAGVTGLKVVCK